MRRGDVARIVEEKDATDDERRVNEINTGVIAFGAEASCAAASRSSTTTTRRASTTSPTSSRWRAQSGVKVQGIVVDSATEVLGINDRAQLAIAERTLQRQIAQDLMARGVTLADPERVDVRGELTVGRDVFIDVGVVFEGKVVLGDRVHIGPYAVIADSKLGADTRRAPAHRDERRRRRRRTARSARSRACGRARCSPAQRQGRQLRRDQEQPRSRRAARSTT